MFKKRKIDILVLFDESERTNSSVRNFLTFFRQVNTRYPSVVVSDSNSLSSNLKYINENTFFLVDGSEVYRKVEDFFLDIHLDRKVIYLSNIEDLRNISRFSNSFGTILRTSMDEKEVGDYASACLQQEQFDLCRSLSLEEDRLDRSGLYTSSNEGELSQEEIKKMNKCSIIYIKKGDFVSPECFMAALVLKKKIVVSRENVPYESNKNVDGIKVYDRESQVGTMIDDLAFEKLDRAGYEELINLHTKPYLFAEVLFDKTIRTL